MQRQRPKTMRSKRKMNDRIKLITHDEIDEIDEDIDLSETGQENHKLAEIVHHSLEETRHTSQSLGVSHKRDNKSQKNQKKKSTVCQAEDELGLLSTSQSDDNEDNTKENDEFDETDKQFFDRCSQQRSSLLEDRRKARRKSAENKQSNGTPDQQSTMGYIKVGDKIDKSEVRCFECIQAIPVKSANEIKPGDHVVECGVIYDHHGIIIDKNGEEFTIREATNTAFRAVLGVFKICNKKARIQSSVKTFDFTKRICVVQYTRRFSPADTIEEAKNADEEYDYNIFRNNCEHFATQCVTGQRISVQVSKLRLAWKLFWTSGFVGISDEVKRNVKGFKKGMICKSCHDMNKKLLNVPKTPIKSEEDIKKGDIIRYTYWNLWHEAVVLKIEDKTKKNVVCTIAHYAFCGPFSLRTIIQEPKTIRLDGKCYKLEYTGDDYNVYDSDEVVARAMDSIGEQWFAFFANDSSHFARWCKLKLRYQNMS